MRVNVAPRRKNSPRPEEKSAPTYLQWLRGRECFLDGRGCGWGDPPRKSFIEAAHVDHGGDKGMSTKASDRFAIPLCQRHHDEQGGKIGSFRQRGGWRSFELKYGFDAVKAAAAYWERWPSRTNWEAKHG
jgi:hypothetical protein